MRNPPRSCEGLQYNISDIPVLESPFHGHILTRQGTMYYFIDGVHSLGWWYKTDTGFDVYTNRRFVVRRCELIPTGPVKVTGYKTDQWGRRTDLQI